jgi:myo-inositol-1(or 4)-monophosphatase
MSKNLTFTAIQAALAAGELLRRGFGTAFDIKSKPGKQNLVTEYDNRAEKMIIETIGHDFPDHAFLAEESGASHGRSHYTWIIDPLDGTVNFAHQIPIFTISIACAHDEQIVTGIVYQPMTNELFIAEKGEGAYLNGRRLHVTENSNLEEAMLATGFPYNVEENPLNCIDRFAQMTSRGIPIRRLGSAALDLAYVAAGRFDAYWEVSLHPWDMAAGKLLVEEAGGKVTHYDGSQHRIFVQDNLLSSNGILHQEMVHHLNSKDLWRSK